MKKHYPLILATASILALAACGGQSADKTKDHTENKTVYAYDPEKGLITFGSFDLLFKGNSDIPYVPLNQGFDLFNSVRKVLVPSASIKVDTNGDKVTATLDNNASVSVDAKEQTIVFSDIDAFNNFSTNKPMTLGSINAKSKALKIKSQTYEAGKSITLDLKPYSKLDVYKFNGGLYLPLTVYSDVFLSAYEGNNISYNGKDVFFHRGGDSFVSFGQLNDLGTKYFEAEKKTTVSAEFAEYNYQALCFNLNYTYGLKDEKKITDFDSWFATYKADMTSGDIHKMDDALTYSLSNLNDGHTIRVMGSPYYHIEDTTTDKTKLNPVKEAWIKGGDDFKKKKKGEGIKTGLEIDETSGTAFIGFDEFTTVSEDLLSMIEFADEEAINANTATIFANAYSKITSAANKDKVKYVVVDLSSNEGGAIDSVIYGLGVLLGDVTIDTIDPLSGAHTKSVYQVDINNDQIIDANDKSLAELGYKIVFLNSEYTFSSANAMAVFAKEINNKVYTVGEKTHGGPCSLRNTSDALGGIYTQSGLNVLAKKSGDKYINIEGGVAADQAADKDSLANRAYLRTMIPIWLSEAGK